LVKVLEYLAYILAFWYSYFVVSLVYFSHFGLMYLPWKIWQRCFTFRAYTIEWRTSSGYRSFGIVTLNYK
jgi:hypothetical protein